MSPLDQARTLLADLLKDGPHNAGEILAAAEGAKISERTMQRAAEQIGVIKTKAGFGDGWTWVMPGNGKASPRVTESVGDRAKVIAARLCRLEALRGHKAPIYGQDPRLVRWVQAGISDPDLKEAYERAVTDCKGMLTTGIMDRYINEVMKEVA